MKFAAAAAAIASIAAATLVNGSPVRRESDIVCQSTPIDQLWSARLKDINANEHPQAKKQFGDSNTKIIASEGLIGVDGNKVFYELYQDDPNLASHFYVQQCNSTALNANQASMQGDLPVKLIYKDDTSLCASAINLDQGEQTSTPLQLLPCQKTDNSAQATQFWAQRKDSTVLAFLGNLQDGSKNYWYSETGGGDSYRTPNVMLHPCGDADCQAGAIDWQLQWD